jgi:hypothetical protein
MREIPIVLHCITIHMRFPTIHGVSVPHNPHLVHWQWDVRVRIKNG